MSLTDIPPQDQASLSQAARDYFAVALERSTEAYAQVPHSADLAYGEDYWQKVDVFYPAKVDGPLPVLMFLHGGGWTHGYKEHCAFMAPFITALPAIFVSVSYRLAPAVRFPVPVEDTVAAVAWVRGNIAHFGGDPDAIFIGGHSAGGHLATMATIQAERLAAAGLPADVIKGCLPVSASFELGVGVLESEGKLLLARPEDAPIASPVNFIGEPSAPFHIVWGKRDFNRCLASTPTALSVFQEKGWSVTSRCVPDADHFQTHLNLFEPQSGWLKAFADMAGIALPGAETKELT